MSKEEAKLKGKLAPIQIGDVQGQDAFMSIETNSFKDDALAILLFICVIFTTTIAGIYGPQLYTPGSVQTLFSDQKTLHQVVQNIGPINRFLTLSLIVKSNTEVKNPNMNTKFAFALTFKRNGNEIKRSDGQSQVPLYFEKDKVTSKPIEFFHERSIDYDEVLINVEFDEIKDLSTGILLWKYGDSNHTVFQTWVRFVFAITTVIIAALFIFRLMMVAKENWNLQQRFTVIYLAVSVISCNILYFLLIFFPSLLHVAFNCILHEIFVGFTWFYILVIIDSFRIKDSPDKYCFYEPKLFIMVLQIISGSAISINSEIHIFTDTVSIVMQIIQSIISFIFIGYIVILIILTYSSADATNLHSYFVYTTVFLLTILFCVVSSFMDSIPFTQNTSGGFSMSFSALHCLCILMAYFHWPYEPSVDQQYNEADEIDQNDEGFEPEIDEALIKNKENKKIESKSEDDSSDDEELHQESDNSDEPKKE